MTETQAPAGGAPRPRPGPGVPPPAATTATFGDRVRFVLRGIGQTLITLGVVVVLFIVYEVWITNWFSERENKQLIQKLEQQWALPGGGPSTVPVGDAIGILYIPRLGQDFAWAIVQGDEVPNQDQLAKGPAHYGRTALPWDSADGNFAVAGHRVGKGEPFLNLDHLKPGDPVIVETRKGWFVYRVKGMQHGLTRPDDVDGLPGREIVDPSDGKVLLPYPDHPGAQPTQHYLTLTTCNPKFTAENRLIVYGTMDPSLFAPFSDPAGKGDPAMPDRIRALYSEATG
ncbi:MAG: class E sortase [Jatrophihabitans sp.]|uniref:class E sortase n=1 Tax=Jatrophihabitans sp. TaxID=1932789 RepID=UPI003F8169A8